ncbi:MAG: nicotinamide mononucleotide transporter [Halioglobus sp.]|nr:nicotinamide mononucleotide transporter [Halioglobus sp.]
MLDNLTASTLVEIVATAANLAYIVLLIRERILCWSFGIAGSLLSVWLFLDARLYSEALLYLFYAVMGVWGWLRWHRRLEENDNPVIVWRLQSHARAIALGCTCALGLGLSAQTFTDAQRPFFDAFTTAFSFIATYMEITRVLEGWVYWFLLNLASIWLYQDRNLDIYAALIGVYSVLSVVGFISWRRSLLLQRAAASV